MRPMLGATSAGVIHPAYERMSQSSWSIHRSSSTILSVTDHQLFAQPLRPAGYSFGAVLCRMLRGDAEPRRAYRPAHRLVDSRRLRTLPGHRPEHMDGVRGSTAGAWPGPYVRPFAGLASFNGPNLGRLAPSSGALTQPAFAI